MIGGGRYQHNRVKGGMRLPLGGGTARIRVYKLRKGIEIHLLFTVKTFS